MDNLLQNLNKEQLEAVAHKQGPLLIVAGAGTGKTTVITRRIAYLIERGIAKSDEILALTFTEKAAGEMEERVDRLLPMGYLDLWISTFHSFGERLLKDHGMEIGLPMDAKLLNGFEQWALIKKNLNKFDLDYYRPLGNPTKFIHALVKHFSRAKDEDISPQEYLNYAEELRENLDGMLSGGKNKKNTVIASEQSERSNPGKSAANTGLPRRSAPRNDDLDKEMAEQEVSRVNEVANAYHVYQQLLLDNNAIDFGDLINYTLKLFRERPAILAEYRRQFKYILLDEFQDTNWAQYEMIKMLAAPKNNLVVVGDDDQSVYKFRGASVSNILQFKKDYPASKEIVLIKNYRNKQDILDLSYEFIKLNNPNRLEWALNTKYGTRNMEQGAGNNQCGLSKKLIADKSGDGEIEVIEGKDVQEEIRLVVEKITDLKLSDKQRSWNDFAVLVRANESAKDICNTLELAGLPHQFLASRGLYAKPVIMNIIAYLKMLDNYHESPALYRVLNLPMFNFSYQELVNFNYWANKKAWSLFEVLRGVSQLKLEAKISVKVSRVLSLIAKHTALVRDKSATEAVLAFLNDSGYLKYLTSSDERTGREATAYLNQFMKRIQAFETGSDDKSVKAFLAELNMEIDAGEQGALAPDMEAGPEAIKIMTVHAAKGLEFKYVFIINMVDKRFPTIERKEPILIPDALIKEILPAGDIHLEEERRLFYVAMTRAREGLFFSWAQDYGGARQKKPSKFLIETGVVKQGIEEKKPSPISNFQFPNKFKIQNPKSKTESFKMPSYFSYTQLAAFANCPYQYRFAHILKIPRQGKPQFSFGKTMHGALQKLFKLVNEKRGLGQGDLFSNAKQRQITPNNAKISLDEVLALYKQSWIDDWYGNKEEKDKYKKKGREILKDFYEKHKDNWPNTKFLEKGFKLKLASGHNVYTVRGVMDRIDEVDGKLKIVDYKTGRPKEKLSLDDKEQLLIYQMAVEDLFRQEVGALAFYYLDNNSEVEFLGAPADLAKVKEKIIRNIEEIAKGEFPPKPGPLCKYCDFSGICEFRRL